MPLVFRLIKGAPLSLPELDSNFTYLKDRLDALTLGVDYDPTLSAIIDQINQLETDAVDILVITDALAARLGILETDPITATQVANGYLANRAVSGEANINFGNEQDSGVSTITIGDPLFTLENIKSVSFIPIEHVGAGLDDFKLNGVSFNIENVVDGQSFDIRGTALNNASGDYYFKYKIIY